MTGRHLSVTVLGPERPDPILPGVLERMGMKGPVALLSAGWRYDEERDEPLCAAIGCTVHNLLVYAAYRDIEREAPDLAAAHARQQRILKGHKAAYRVVIANAVATLQRLWPERTSPFFAEAVRHLRAADAEFLAVCDSVHASFIDEVRPDRHPRVRSARAHVAEVLSGCEAVLIAGGHVGVLRNRLAFFDLGEILAGQRIIAWSAGAMALTERILLYHDFAGHGVGSAEMLDRGLGLVKGVVYLPHAHQRLALNDPAAVGILARRLQPARAIGLENRARVVDGVATGAPGTQFELDPEGTLIPLGEADAARP